MTARERFVEAQQLMWQALCEYHSFGYNITHRKWMLQAIEAFADAECNHLLGEFDDAAMHVSHDSCRTALLKECGLEK